MSEEVKTRFKRYGIEETLPQLKRTGLRAEAYVGSLLGSRIDRNTPSGIMVPFTICELIRP